jgi:hypothetical protein
VLNILVATRASPLPQFSPAADQEQELPVGFEQSQILPLARKSGQPVTLVLTRSMKASCVLRACNDSTLPETFDGLFAFGG